MKKIDLSFLTLCMALATLLVSCGGDDTDIGSRVTGTGPVKEKKVTIPSQVLGLQVQREDITKQLQGTKRPYIDSVGLFSLREGDLVRATFQVSHFNSLARPGDLEFRSAIISLLGSSRPEQILLNGITVYVTTGNEQNIFIWFIDDGFYVLTAHQNYEFPRTLLRRLIDRGPLV